MRKLIIFMLSVLLLLVLVGCNEEDNDNSDQCTHDFENQIFEATCTTFKKSIPVCTKCGFLDENNTRVLDTKLGHHQMTQKTVAATCTSYEMIVDVCDLCDYKETVKTIGSVYADHAYEIVSTTDATCTLPAYEKRICSHCERSETKEVPNSYIDHQGIARCRSCYSTYADILKNHFTRKGIGKKEGNVYVATYYACTWRIDTSNNVIDIIISSGTETFTLTMIAEKETTYRVVYEYKVSDYHMGGVVNAASITKNSTTLDYAVESTDVPQRDILTWQEASMTVLINLLNVVNRSLAEIGSNVTVANLGFTAFV